MSNFIIMTDSTTDFDREFYEKTGVFHHPHGFVLEGKEYKDIFWTEMSSDDYYTALRNGAAVTTSMPEMALVEERAEAAFKEGKDAMYISFSAQLSGTFNMASVVAADLMEKYPGRTMRVVDSRCASQGQGILVQMAVRMRDEGKSVDETADFLEIERGNIYHFFTVDDLMHLKRGGRLSATSAVMGTLIGIKPVLHMSKEGKLEAVGKVRGRHNAINEIVKMALEKYGEGSGVVHILHVGCEDAGKQVEQKLLDGGVKETHLYQLGPAISAHLGIGSVGVLIRDGR